MGRQTHTTERILRLVGPESIRMDPIAIAIWREKGGEWCSGPGAALEVRDIPTVFEHYWTIEEYGGSETVHVNMAEAFADILHDYMDTGDHARLADRYRTLKAASAGLKELPMSVPDAESGLR